MVWFKKNHIFWDNIDQYTTKTSHLSIIKKMLVLEGPASYCFFFAETGRQIGPRGDPPS